MSASGRAEPGGKSNRAGGALSPALARTVRVFVGGTRLGGFSGVQGGEGEAGAAEREEKEERGRGSPRRRGRVQVGRWQSGARWEVQPCWEGIVPRHFEKSESLRRGGEILEGFGGVEGGGGGQGQQRGSRKGKGVGEPEEEGENPGRPLAERSQVGSLAVLVGRCLPPLLAQ